jgi:hypothetical protein
VLRIRQTRYCGIHQQQVGSLPVNSPFKIAAAHPTPFLTSIAPKGQFRAQAPHSMQRSRSMILTLPPDSAKTLCGHTAAHMPQFVHFSSSCRRVTTFFKYFMAQPSFLSQTPE